MCHLGKNTQEVIGPGLTAATLERKSQDAIGLLYTRSDGTSVQLLLSPRGTRIVEALSTRGCYRALNGASYRNYEACHQAPLQSLLEFFMVLLQGSPSVQLLPHGSFSASNTAACWNSANCPAVFQSRSHVSGNKQDQLHETLDVPHAGQVCRGADHSIVKSCGSTEGHQDVSHLVDLGTARSVSRNQATPAVQTCTNLVNSSSKQLDQICLLYFIARWALVAPECLVTASCCSSDTVEPSCSCHPRMFPKALLQSMLVLPKALLQSMLVPHLVPKILAWRTCSKKLVRTRHQKYVVCCRK